jgi:hypothetical protein
MKKQEILPVGGDAKAAFEGTYQCKKCKKTGTHWEMCVARHECEPQKPRK